jgi:HK97 family phage portal protein
MSLTALNLNTPPYHTFTNSGASTMAAPSADLIQSLLGFPAAAGKPVTRATAIRVAAVLSSVKVLANDIAKMPLILHETSVVGGHQRRQPAISDPLYSILKDIPNRWQTSYQLRWFLASQLIMKGACYCQKITDQKGDVVELVPLNAWNMDIKWDYSGGPNPQRDQRTGKVVPVLCWHYMDGHSVVQKFYQEDLWHVTSHNIEGIGVEGASLIALGKEAISVLIAAEETAGRQFANGLGMGGFISFPVDGGPDESQAQNVVDRLKKDFSGSQNAGKFTIIPHGGKWEKMTFNAQESQLLESRKWNEETVARLFGGAPLVVKLGLGAQNSTYASSSAFLDEYFNTSLLPYTTAFEQSIQRDLIQKAERGKKYAKHNADIILRGSPDERAKTNAALINSMQLTPNEARAIEDRDYIEGGDVLVAAANSCIFDIAEQEWFIPGQKPPESAGTDNNAPKPAESGEPDAEGGNSDTEGTEPKTAKVKARLAAIANSLAERCERKFEKSGTLEAKFVAEVMSVSLEEAQKVCATAFSNKEERRAALVKLALGEHNEA